MYYACLCRGDVLSIAYSNEVYEIEIADCKPDEAVGIIDTDINLEFKAPKDYKEVKVFLRYANLI
jgi:hypothetical protein